VNTGYECLVREQRSANVGQDQVRLKGAPRSAFIDIVDEHNLQKDVNLRGPALLILMIVPISVSWKTSSSTLPANGPTYAGSTVLSTLHWHRRHW
jgi:hypothetical protein